MTTSAIEDIKKALERLWEDQLTLVATWHDEDPADIPEHPVEGSLQALAALGAREHLTKHLLWHVEDEARRKDVDATIITKCKQDIDGYNQRRNDLIEKVDACLVALLSPLLPADAPQRYNTETVGNGLDRLSIISLKIYHMGEQTRRTDVDEEHLASCRVKLDTLHEQRKDLGRSILELVDEYAAGTKRPKVYYQFKMYNDPALNPSLYGKGKA